MGKFKNNRHNKSESSENFRKNPKRRSNGNFRNREKIFYGANNIVERTAEVKGKNNKVVFNGGGDIDFETARNRLEGIFRAGKCWEVVGQTNEHGENIALRAFDEPEIDIEAEALAYNLRALNELEVHEHNEIVRARTQLENRIPPAELTKVIARIREKMSDKRQDLLIEGEEKQRVRLAREEEKRQEREKEFLEKQADALNIFEERLGAVAMAAIQTEHTAGDPAACWDRLIERFSSASRGGGATAANVYFENCQFDPSTTVWDIFFEIFLSNISRKENAGDHSSDMTLRDQLISALERGSNLYRAQIHHVKFNKQGFRELVDLVEERNIELLNRALLKKEQANYARDRGGVERVNSVKQNKYVNNFNKANVNNKKKRDSFTCYRCGGEGHMAKDCTKKACKHCGMFNHPSDRCYNKNVNNVNNEEVNKVESRQRKQTRFSKHSNENISQEEDDQDQSVNGWEEMYKNSKEKN